VGYTFSRKCSWDFEVRCSPMLEACSTVLSQDAGQKQQVTVCEVTGEGKHQKPRCTVSLNCEVR
jgi:hypothetical protein